jgi:acetyl esterase/lipase
MQRTRKTTGEPRMDTTTRAQFEIDIEDVEYIRHGDKPLLARVYKPRGARPFPLAVEIHGGAWCRSDRLQDATLHEIVARSGIVVAAVDFRMPPDAPYPASIADINFAIRWFKAKAARFNIDANRVAIMGSSSGGHQAMLVALRPHDLRYTALKITDAAGIDASVNCAVLYWPVIDPLGRYEYAKKLKAAGGNYPPVVDRVLPDHDRYWQSEEAMSEGSPTRIMERGEKTALPPVLYLQGTVDVAHPRPNLDRFVAAYRKAGGEVDLQLYEGEGEGFFIYRPDTPVAADAVGKIVAFLQRELAGDKA